MSTLKQLKLKLSFCYVTFYCFRTIRDLFGETRERSLKMINFVHSVRRSIEGCIKLSYKSFFRQSCSVKQKGRKKHKLELVFKRISIFICSSVYFLLVNT